MAKKRWLGLTCSTCSFDIPLFQADPDVTVDATGAFFQTVCPNCGLAAKYPGEQLRFLAEKKE